MKEPLVAKQQIEEEELQVILVVKLPQQVDASVVKWGYLGLALVVAVVQ